MNSEEKTKPQREMPFRYLFGGIVILTLFVSAIVLPDVLPYLFPSRIAPLSAAVAPAPAPGTTVPTSAPAPASATGLPLVGAPQATVQLFETYARLVTLFIGVASVLGLFFGYFVRKSIRDTEEDVYKRFDRSLALWEKERATLLEQYRTDAAALEEQIKVSKNLEQKMREYIEELADVLASNRAAQSSTAPPVGETTAKVDEQLGDL